MRGAGSGTFVLGLVVSGHVVDRYWIAGLLGAAAAAAVFFAGQKNEDKDWSEGKPGPNVATSVLRPRR
jgi:hypothetical protein